MASLDYVYDLLEKFNQEKMDYVVVVVQKGEEIYQANIFEKTEGKASKQVMYKTLVEINKNLAKELKKKK